MVEKELMEEGEEMAVGATYVCVCNGWVIGLGGRLGKVGGRGMGVIRSS